MPHTTMRTTPQILEEMVLRHVACTQWICVTGETLTKRSIEPDIMARYVRHVRQAECIARFLHTPIREEDPSDKGSLCSLQSGLTGVFLQTDDTDGFLIEEHCMSTHSPMHGLLNRHIGDESDGWKLIAIKF